MSKKLNYSYETLRIGELDIHVRSLRDTQEYQDENDIALNVGITDSQWSLFGVIWPAGFVLATLMEQKNVEGLKILEIGCGLALASLVLKVRGCDVTVTDYNPAVSNFLKENVRINECLDIPFIQANWQDRDFSLGESYDLIIGSDILYERNHPQDIADFIDRNAKPKCEVIIVDPNRGNQNRFTREMESNRFIHRKNDHELYDRFFKKFKGNVHYYDRE